LASKRLIELHSFADSVLATNPDRGDIPTQWLHEITSDVTQHADTHLADRRHISSHHVIERQFIRRRSGLTCSPRRPSAQTSAMATIAALTWGRVQSVTATASVSREDFRRAEGVGGCVRI
jgi:DNA topoisomerase IA